MASKCGLTPQYTGLEQPADLQRSRFQRRRLPHQFAGEEPVAPRIATFCSTTYGVSFDDEKIEANGPSRHPIYDELTKAADAEGHTGDIRWNFEKFLVAPDGTVTRFSPMVTPEDPALVSAIEASLPG